MYKEQIAKNTYSFYFDRTANPTYAFSAGQYTKVFLDAPKDPIGTWRMFTTCSSPRQIDRLMITTKVDNNSGIFKQKMAGLQKGDKVKFSGPLGGFSLPKKSTSPLILLAGGIGITPFHSMLLHAAAINFSSPITFIVSFSTVEEMIFYDELSRLSKDHPNIKVVYTISRPEQSHNKWDGETGRISEQLIKKYASSILTSTYFIAGSSMMVSSMLDLLEVMGIPDDQVREEQLTGY